MDAIQTLEDLMRRHREEGRVVQYLDLVPVVAALKAQRDELLAGLVAAMPQGMDPSNNNIPDSMTVPVDFTMGELRAMDALIAKHKEASHG